MSGQKKEVTGDREELLRNLILSKLKTIRKEKFNPKIIDKFSLVFRVFLLRYLKLNYEFTLEELVNDLKKIKIPDKVKERITTLSTLLVEIEYEGKKISKEEFKLILNEAESIINLATGKADEKIEEKTLVKNDIFSEFLHKIGLVKTLEERAAIKKGRLEVEKERKKLREAKEKKGSLIKGGVKGQIEAEKTNRDLEKEKSLEERRKRPIILPPPAPFPNIWSSEQAEKNSIQKKKSDNVGPIKKKIDEAKTAIDNSQLNDAKRIYINIMKTYLSLNPKEQSEIYNDIKELYIHRKSKEKIINKSS